MFSRGPPFGETRERVPSYNLAGAGHHTKRCPEGLELGGSTQGGALIASEPNGLAVSELIFGGCRRGRHAWGRIA
jgi:hypothetical protein